MSPEEDLESVARKLAQLLEPRDAGKALVFKRVERAAPPARVAAVDGSSAMLLDARAFCVGAYRAHALLLEGQRRSDAGAPPPRLALLSRTSRAGDEPPEAGLDALRTKAENEASTAAVSVLGAGDLLLIDGPLAPRDPHRPRAGIEALFRAAAARGVFVAGVCKSTSLRVDGLPALPVARARSHATDFDTWWTELPSPAPGLVRVVAAKLSPAEAWGFRIDLPQDQDVDATLAACAALAGHPAYPGYPSPLAMAHNAVIIDDALQNELAQRLRKLAESAGASGEAWDMTFTDYHDVLDLGR